MYIILYSYNTYREIQVEPVTSIAHLELCISDLHFPCINFLRYVPNRFSNVTYAVAMIYSPSGVPYNIT